MILPNMTREPIGSLFLFLSQFIDTGCITHLYTDNYPSFHRINIITKRLIIIIKRWYILYPYLNWQYPYSSFHPYYTSYSPYPYGNPYYPYHSCMEKCMATTGYGYKYCHDFVCFPQWTTKRASLSFFIFIRQNKWRKNCNYDKRTSRD